MYGYMVGGALYRSEVKEEGMLEVIETENPYLESPDSYFYYEQDGNKIIQKWVEHREPTPEEKLAELEKQLDDLSATLVNQI